MKLHDGLKGNAVGRRRKQRHIVMPPLMAHQGVDVPLRRQRSNRSAESRNAPRLMPISFYASSEEKTPWQAASSKQQAASRLEA